VPAELSFPHASYLVQDVRMADIRLGFACLLATLRQNKASRLLYLGHAQIKRWFTVKTEIQSKNHKKTIFTERGKIMATFGKFLAIPLTQRSVNSVIYTLFFINIVFISSSCRLWGVQGHWCTFWGFCIHLKTKTKIKHVITWMRKLSVKATEQ